MAIHGLMNQQPFVIWDGVFELHYLENRGAAFGILQERRSFCVFYADRTLSDRVSLPETYSRREKFRPMDGICILFLPEHWETLLTVFSAITWSISFILN